MKRFGISIVLAGVLLGQGAWAADEVKPKAAEPPETPETVVHTFTDEAQMTAFAELWRQRQSAVLRMSVLQAYWNEEQAVITQVNGRLTQDYHVDPAKNYSLDTQRRVLLEQPAPATARSPGPPVTGAGAGGFDEGLAGEPGTVGPGSPSAADGGTVAPPGGETKKP